MNHALLSLPLTAAVGNPFLASMHTWLRVALLQESSQSMDAQHVGTFQEFTAHGLSALGDGSASSSVIPELAMAVADVDPSLVEDFYGVYFSMVVH